MLEGMRTRWWVFGAAVGAVGVVTAMASRAAARSRSSSDRPDQLPEPGWATCSAPGARAYEATFGRLLVGLYGAIATDLARSLPARSGLQIVDVGAGPGGLAVALAGAFPDAGITAVDIDAAMAALARARVAREGLDGRIRVSVADVAALPLATHSVDLVTSSFSVHHWPDAAAGFAEIHRVLRPGGRVIIYDLPDWWGRFETQAPSLVQAASSGGFPEVASSRLRWPGPMAVVHRVDASG
jgi:SAM-dependent methyltransferase